MLPNEIIENIINYMEYSNIENIVLINKYYNQEYDNLKSCVFSKSKAHKLITCPDKQCIGCFYYDDKNKMRCRLPRIKDSCFCNLCGFNITENSISFNDFVYLNRVF